jgi:hypothetical protein
MTKFHLDYFDNKDAEDISAEKWVPCRICFEIFQRVTDEAILRDMRKSLLRGGTWKLRRKRNRDMCSVLQQTGDGIGKNEPTG